MRTQTATFAIVLLLCAGAVFAQGAVERARRDEVFLVPGSDPAMAAAFRKARDTLEGFLELAKQPPPGVATTSVKVAITEGRETEYFWVSPFTQHGDDRFVGRLNNYPRLVRGYTFGQEITFSKKEIVDWTYFDKSRNRRHGNFTACALLTKETPENAAKFKREFGLECDA